MEPLLVQGGLDCPHAGEDNPERADGGDGCHHHRAERFLYPLDKALPTGTHGCAVVMTTVLSGTHPQCSERGGIVPPLKVG